MSTPQRILDLRQYAASADVQKNIRMSPLLVHFLAESSRVLGISEAEFMRRIAYNALMDWIQAGLYQIPEEIFAEAQKSPVLKRNSPTVRNLKQYRNTPDRPPSDAA